VADAMSNIHEMPEAARTSKGSPQRQTAGRSSANGQFLQTDFTDQTPVPQITGNRNGEQLCPRGS